LIKTHVYCLLSLLPFKGADLSYGYLEMIAKKCYSFTARLFYAYS
jgi:hypothetical protein